LQHEVREPEHALMSCGRDISPPEAIQTIEDETIRTDLEDGDI
jgi:hypothetical protein